MAGNSEEAIRPRRLDVNQQEDGQRPQQREAIAIEEKWERRKRPASHNQEQQDKGKGWNFVVGRDDLRFRQSNDEISAERDDEKRETKYVSKSLPQALALGRIKIDEVTLSG